jgi:hypothetical protein
MDPVARAALDASVALISPDLRFVLSERDVLEALQGKLSDAGYGTIGLFVAMVDSKATLRATLISDFDLDPAAQGLAVPEIILRRVNCAKMVDAWDACSRRQDENDRLQATQRASRLPMTGRFFSYYPPSEVRERLREDQRLQLSLSCNGRETPRGVGARRDGRRGPDRCCLC